MERGVDPVSYSSAFRDAFTSPASSTVTHSVISLAILVSATQLALQLWETLQMHVGGATECFVLTEVHFSKMQSSERERERESAGNSSKYSHHCYRCKQIILESRMYCVGEMLTSGEDRRLKTYAWMNRVTILSSVSAKATVQHCRTPG